MNNCQSGCVEGMKPSKCVEFDSTSSVYDKLISVDSKLSEIDVKFTKSVDGKTLGTGQDLIATVQKLVDNQISNQPSTNTQLLENNTEQFSVDLQCLLGTNCDTVTTQKQLNNLLIKKLCSLINTVNSLQTNY